MCFATVMSLGCGSSDSPPATGAGNTTSGSTAAGSSGSGGGTMTGASTSSSTSSSGTAGAGGNAIGTTGASGSSGAGGGSGGTPTDASVVIDSGIPKVDAPHDVVSGDSPPKARHTPRPIGMPYANNGFWEYLPPGYGDGTKRPLLVFWHGVGEDGSGSAADLAKVLVHGPPMLINLNQWPSDRPFVVLSPQHGPTDCPTATEIRDFITFGLASYDVDPARVYLTGLSCGALGSSSYLGQFQGQQVVAAVLIAGDASIAYNMAGCALLQDVALWSFHGDADVTVPIGPDTTGMMNFMACAMPHKDAKYTVYPGVDHVGSWTRTYDLTAGNDIYTWMLAQHR